MINFTQKYKTHTELAKHYSPMSFKFRGITRNERLPKRTPASLLALLRRAAKEALGKELTYFDLRASLTPEQRKMGDLIFITHFSRSHDRDAENVSRSERLRYYWLRFRYSPELIHVYNQLYDGQGQPKFDLPEYVEMYLLRWGYLMSVSPNFVELVHGTYVPNLAIDKLF